MTYLSDLIIEAKYRYREPYMVVTGDFSQWEVRTTLEDLREVGEVDVGPTRGTATIDRIFANFTGSVSDCGTVLPSGVDPGKPGSPSDHWVAFAEEIGDIQMVTI